MKPAILLLMIAGFFAFGVGAFLAVNDTRLPGIALMVLGLMCQIITLRQLKLAKSQQQEDEL